MRVEHIGLQVEDPEAMAKWYCEHLGMKVAVQKGTCYFISDESGNGVLEIYNNPNSPAPDYASMDPLLLHFAFCSDDVAADRERLLAAGATATGEMTSGATGNVLAMMRDPWGLPIQLAKRERPVLIV